MTGDFWQLYEVVPGFDTLPDSETDNFEVWFDLPLRGKRVPLGANAVTTLDGYETIEGAQDVELTTEGCTFAELDAYVTAIFGDWNADDAEVTIRWRQRDNSFEYFNAVAHLPVDGQDYEHETTLLVTDVHLRFRIVGVAGGFSAGFSSGFRG